MPYLIDPSGGGASQLPVTGQFISYSSGDDGYYRAGYDPATRFEVADIGGDLVVIDHATSLVWPKNIDTFHNNTKPSWYDSITALEASTFAGFSDWRLPNVRELSSIIDYGLGRMFTVFSGARVADSYWSSTTYRMNTSMALTVLMQGSSQMTVSKTTQGSQLFVGTRNL